MSVGESLRVKEVTYLSSPFFVRTLLKGGVKKKVLKVSFSQSMVIVSHWLLGISCSLLNLITNTTNVFNILKISP